MIWLLLIPVLLLVLLLIPVRGIVLWRTKSHPKVTLRWLFFQYTVYPRKTRPKKRPEKKRPEKPPRKEKKTPAPKTPEEFSKQLGLIVDLLASGKGMASFVLRRFKFYKVKLDMIVAREDAARTAIAYGRVNAVVYGIYAVAKNFLRLGHPEISIRPNFTAEEGDAKLELRGSLTPLAALGAAFVGGGGFLLRTIKRGKTLKTTETVEE